jgi:hypothetical protein
VTYILSGSPGRNLTAKTALLRATSIGGIVRDEKGRPIEGARVFPTSPFEYNLVWTEVYASRNSLLANATTDAQVRWRADAMGWAPQ